MPTDFPHAALTAAWTPARTAGALGAASIEALRAHTAGYVSVVCRVLDVDASAVVGRGIDVGSGAGVPGVLLAWELTETEWKLIDSQERRCWFASQAARALGLSDRVEVEHGRAEDLAHGSEWRGAFDCATARLLGDPAETTELVVPFLKPGGVAVISCREDQAVAWRNQVLDLPGVAEAAVHAEPSGTFLSLVRAETSLMGLPRRPNRRRRDPLFHMKQ